VAVDLAVVLAAAGVLGRAEEPEEQPATAAATARAAIPETAFLKMAEAALAAGVTVALAS
jgi:hypothetical protein